jgi:hypothetical protein
VVLSRKTGTRCAELCGSLCKQENKNLRRGPQRIHRGNTEVQILQLIANEYIQKISRFVREKLFIQIKYKIYENDSGLQF